MGVISDEKLVFLCRDGTHSTTDRGVSEYCMKSWPRKSFSCTIFSVIFQTLMKISIQNRLEICYLRLFSDCMESIPQTSAVRITARKRRRCFESCADTTIWCAGRYAHLQAVPAARKDLAVQATSMMMEQVHLLRL